MTNLERIRLELRDQNGIIFTDDILEAFLNDNGLNGIDTYDVFAKAAIMLSVKDALRSLLRDWDAAQTKISGDYQESYSKNGIISEIERIEREYNWDITVSEISYED